MSALLIGAALQACGGGGSGSAPSQPGPATVDRLPVAVADSFSTPKNQALSGNLASNDSGLEDAPVTYRLASNSQPLFGTLTLSASGSFSYTPQAAYIGEDNFSYTVTDSNGSTSTATIRITMNPLGNEVVWPAVASAIARDPAIEVQAATLLARMSLRDKVAQMTQAELGSVTVAEAREYRLGSVLGGGGTQPYGKAGASVADWMNLADAFYQASLGSGLGIPLIWGTDAVHGSNNVTGATLFPHNIGLGAARDPALIKAIGAATAREVVATGLDWTFAPTIAVVRDDRWGRTYESYSEDPELVRSYAGQMIEGLQGSGAGALGAGRVLATAKHYLADGGTINGVNEGNSSASEAQLLAIHAQGYLSALGAGAQTVMASYNSWQGTKIHGSHYLLTNVLKRQMGFDGFVVSDWNGIGQVPGCRNDRCPQAINAGIDMVMVPQDWKVFIANTVADVEAGAIPLARIDDAVTRILRVKLRAGMFTKGAPSTRALTGSASTFGSPAHRALARDAVAKSLVLLKNSNGLLPLKRTLNVLVAGDGADNLPKQSGGWSVSWQGTGHNNSHFPGGTTIWQGIAQVVGGAGGKATLSVDGSFTAQPDVAIVVFGEEPYAEGAGDIAVLEYQAATKRDLALLKSLRSRNIPLVAVFLTGRPLWINKELNASDAFVVAWLPGSEGAGIADVLFRAADGLVARDFHGTLSFSWPLEKTQFVLNRFDPDYRPLFPYGFGLTYLTKDSLGNNLPE